MHLQEVGLVKYILGRILSVNSFFLLLLLCSCGTVPSFMPLQDNLLEIINIIPSEGEGYNGSIIIEFNQQIQVDSVNENSLCVVSNNIIENMNLDVDDACEKVEKLSSEIILMEDMYSIEIKIDQELLPGEYSVLITNGLLSTLMVPFSGDGMFMRPYQSKFIIYGENSEGALLNENTGNDIEENLIRPTYLYINEVLYDIEGSDTNGDCFIELLGEPETSLNGYIINLINGDDGKTYKSIKIESNKLIPEDGIFLIADQDSSGHSNVTDFDYLVNFDPQNGPDSIQLINSDYELVDVLGYGNLNPEVADNGLAMFEFNPSDDASSGQSVCRLQDADSDNNSEDFGACPMPTPGIMNGSEGDR